VYVAPRALAVALFAPGEPPQPVTATASAHPRTTSSRVRARFTIADGTAAPRAVSHPPVCYSIPMDAAELTAVEKALRERADALEVRLTGMTTPPERGTGISFGKRVGDGTTEAVRRLTEVGVGTSLEASHLRVLRALQKLDEGTYGVCDMCGRPIAPARLKFSPESVLCIDCARAAR
jgi:RNA polymerase-binding transcription factor